MATAKVEVQDTEENELDSALEASQTAEDVKDDIDSKDVDTEESDADADKVDADDKGADEDTKDSDKSDPVAERMSKLEEDNKELKQMLRVQSRASKISEQKLTRIGKRAAKAGEDGFEETDPDKEEEVSGLETLQNNLNAIGEARGDMFELMLDNMELREASSDARQVCTQNNFSDVFDVIARHQTEQSGGDFDENLLKVELQVWSMKNPYKYMYGVIKEYHPDYAKPEERTTEDDPAAVLKKDKEADSAVKKKAKKVDAPGSIANMGGGDVDSKGGWTAARIDALPEDKLNTVPEAVYEKYLADELE